MERHDRRIAEAVQRARQRERAAIIRYLRNVGTVANAIQLHAAADLIEEGNHADRS